MGHEGQPHGGLVRVVRIEGGTRDEGHAFLHRERQQPGGVDPVPQAGPQEHTSVRAGDVGVLREDGLEFREHGPRPLGVDGTYALEVCLDVGGRKIPCHGQLVRHGRLQPDRLLGHRERELDGPLGAHPPDPHSRGDDLGHRVQQDRLRGHSREGCDGGHGLARVRQLAVRVVLHERGAGAQQDVRDGAASFHGHADPGRVLEGRDQIDEGGVVLGDEPLELLRHHAVLVRGDAHHVRTVEIEGLHGRQVGGPFHEDHVPRVDQCLGHHEQPLLGSRGHLDLVRGGGQVPADPAGRLLAQFQLALARGVLQRTLGMVREHPLVGGLDVIDLEVRRIRHTTGERDHTLLGHHLQQITHGGGIHPAQTVGDTEREGFEGAHAASIPPAPER